MYKILIDDVVPGIIIEQDIYSEDGKGNPLLCAGTAITAQFIFKLKQRGVRYVATQAPESFGKNNADSERKVANPLARISVSVEKSRPAVVPKTKNEVIKIMKDFHITLSGLDAEEVGKIINVLDDILNNVLDGLPEDLTKPINVHHLRGVEVYPVYTYLYRHALSVAVIAMALGQYLGLPHADILPLGKAASLHDVGMFLIPLEIMQKTKTLDEEEYQSVKKHTVLGYQALKKLQAVDEQIYQGIATHHERLDGSGYPLGLQGEQIPLWGRIIAVADVYDAMTANRPYRTALSPAEACEYIMGGANKYFEYDIVAALLRRIEFYPVGVCVELSNKNLAIILDNSKNKLRPKMQCMHTKNIFDLNERDFLDVTILRAVSYSELLAK